MNAQPTPTLGVSQCLLGEPVRYDGGHRREAFLVERLAGHVAWVPVCPEAVLGIPREPMHLVRENGVLALRGNASGTDCSEPVHWFVQQRVTTLANAGLDGYVLKARSPSCGLQVQVANETNPSAGLFAGELVEALPDLPLIEEDALAAHNTREAFLERVFAHARVRALFATPWTPADLVRFHTREKMLLLSHDRAGYDQLGRFVAQAATQPQEDVARRYRRRFMGVLAKPASVGQHVNVLQHMAGHFRDRLDPSRLTALHEAIDACRQGEHLVRDLYAQIRAMARELDIRWVGEQSILTPFPQELLTEELHD
ncbi:MULTISPECIES: DUF523 and DUF1722 domain-containing protein [unclassified Thioalkalivibrio]|uniref:DUF523 and DUF1722 domain-containing protein n=1 Tax=unclassified Thioalkalivibrio TaxID=2621013 RepID=UPI000477FCCF|nr:MULTISPECIES: DUF523 and DUF1722 domain-containing protein [unclassified Thioalkalivibrio]